MRQNLEIELHGKKSVLVPYEKHLINKYHEWMQDEKLREETASEYLTWEEELLAWRSWIDDENKCTFIVLDKDLRESGKSDVEAMVGDCNLFISEEEDSNGNNAEVMVMTAPVAARRKGFASEALSLLWFEELGIETLKAKIAEKNDASLKLFEKFGFSLKESVNIFGELTLYKKIAEPWILELKKTCGYVKLPHKLLFDHKEIPL